MDIIDKDGRWRYPRFFCGNIGEIGVVTGDDAKHISTVLRLKKGEYVVLCDGKGTDYLACITEISKDFVNAEILASRKNSAEPTVYIRLFQCMPKSDKMEFIVQKATELGVSEIIPVISKRCISRPDDKSMQKKIERYQKIAYEAAKQCGRGVVPTVQNMVLFSKSFDEYKNRDIGILLYECGGKRMNELVAENFSGILDVYVGSEGGFEEEEAKLAGENGICSVGLGERIMRCETAPIAALSILMNITNNM